MKDWRSVETLKFSAVRRIERKWCYSGCFVVGQCPGRARNLEKIHRWAGRYVTHVPWLLLQRARLGRLYIDHQVAGQALVTTQAAGRS